MRPEAKGLLGALVGVRSLRDLDQRLLDRLSNVNSLAALLSGGELCLQLGELPMRLVGLGLVRAQRMARRDIFIGIPRLRPLHQSG